MQVLELTASPPLARRYTLEEFFELPEPEGRAHLELIGGFLFMVPPPDEPHGTFDARLARSLHRHLLDDNIGGEVHHPREAIYVEESKHTYLEPDMMYVSDELLSKMEKKRTCADIVFEYLSESSALYDRTTKADTYLLLGVRELWLIDGESRTIEVREAIMAENLPAWCVRRYSVGEFAESLALPGWRVSVEEILAGMV